MSFEVYLQCFERGEPAGLARTAIRRLFPMIDAESKPDRWTIRYDDLNSCDIALTSLPSDAALVTSMTIVRPCGDMRLWESLLKVMQLGPIILYCPGDSVPLATSARVGDHMPPDMVETLGRPRVVTSAQDIVDAIRAA